ncbi:metallophosphoesterase 1-like [Penaeus monodon]|uniref:metallophosphoesterase 1-like n=1 Tax=Penaeus monodon TaxID=6687 RepID=UPI0018A7174B|nr:metallophosphoesterase 1-like [Penaeus monodon]
MAWIQADHHDTEQQDLHQNGVNRSGSQWALRMRESRPINAGIASRDSPSLCPCALILNGDTLQFTSEGDIITKFRCIIFILTSVVLFNEWLSYTICAMNWPVTEEVKEEHVKVLIAADPQILSTDSEPGFPFNYIAVWDADRFVSRGFQLALWRTRPQVVIFLGDVLDDGSTSSDAGFRAKAEHFKNLLRIPDYVERTIYVPGDNDIGGEGMDQVTPSKVSRFFSAFKQTDVDSFKFLDFIQLHIMDTLGNETQPLPEDENRMRILLSHMPLLPITRKAIKKTIVEHHPSLIFRVTSTSLSTSLAKKALPEQRNSGPSEMMIASGRLILSLRNCMRSLFPRVRTEWARRAMGTAQL